MGRCETPEGPSACGPGPPQSWRGPVGGEAGTPPFTFGARLPAGEGPGGCCMALSDRSRCSSVDSSPGAGVSFSHHGEVTGMPLLSAPRENRAPSTF